MMRCAEECSILTAMDDDLSLLPKHDSLDSMFSMKGVCFSLSLSP
jgi:hypothetical protein